MEKSRFDHGELVEILLAMHKATALDSFSVCVPCEYSKEFVAFDPWNLALQGVVNLMAERMLGARIQGALLRRGELRAQLIIAMRSLIDTQAPVSREFRHMIDPLANLLLAMQIPASHLATYDALWGAVEVCVGYTKHLGVGLGAYLNGLHNGVAHTLVVRLTSSPAEYVRNCQNALSLFHPDRTSLLMLRCEEEMRERIGGDPADCAKLVAKLATNFPCPRRYENWRDAQLDRISDEVARLWPDTGSDA